MFNSFYSLSNCPRCERRAARELNWQVSEAKMNRDAERKELSDEDDGGDTGVKLSKKENGS